MAKPFRYPARFDRLVEAVMERDREYFSRHPGERAYIRPYVPGEFWPERVDAMAVRVALLGPGVRIRQPVNEAEVVAV